jgi:hypothetical protein
VILFLRANISAEAGARQTYEALINACEATRANDNVEPPHTPNLPHDNWTLSCKRFAETGRDLNPVCRRFKLPTGRQGWG